MRVSAAFLIPLSIALTIGAYVKQLADAKIAHEATAMVKRKEHVRYDEINRSFIDDDGYRIERTPGDEEWRVYYQIGEFRGFDEHTCKRLLEAEEDRAASGKLRYTILFKDEYDSIDIGDTLTVIYQRITDNRLIIDTVIDFRKPER